MITLDKYKKYMVDYYDDIYDSTVNKKSERKKLLSDIYSDARLQKVIIQSYDFIKDILNDKKARENGYICIELDKYRVYDLIAIDRFRERECDTWYYDSNDRIISEYILKRTFGKNICIERINEEVVYDVGEDDIFGVEEEYKLRISNFPKNMEEIRRKLFGTQTIQDVEKEELIKFILLNQQYVPGLNLIYDNLYRVSKEKLESLKSFCEEFIPIQEKEKVKEIAL